ncbi:MAG TPA: glycosyltransferase, partial [Terricaulis sp.]|nr:glycosyltransferase [Terricaulis sp.]
MPQLGSRLSVIIPTFERPEATARAVASALEQDLALEVLVVDDGSRTPFAIGDGAPNVKIIRLGENMGPA